MKGIGIGNYTAYTNAKDQLYGVEKQSSAYQPVHNIYLLVISELGIFGLLALLLFLLSNTRCLTWKNPWTLGLSLAVVSLLTIGLFDHYLWTLHFGILLFWITFSLLEYSRK